jgi:hypothetical protein
MGDVFQPLVLILQVGQLCSDSLERNFWKLPSGEVDVPTRLLHPGTGLVSRLRGGGFPCLRNKSRSWNGGWKGWFRGLWMIPLFRLP